MGVFFAPMKRTHALNKINIEFGGVGGGGGYDVLAWAFFSHTPVAMAMAIASAEHPRGLKSVGAPVCFQGPAPLSFKDV